MLHMAPAHEGDQPATAINCHFQELIRHLRDATKRSGPTHFVKVILRFARGRMYTLPIYQGEILRPLKP